MNIDIAAYLMITFFNGVIALVLLLAGVWLVKKTMFNEEFSNVLQEKGVSGGAVVLGCFILGLSFVIATASF